MPVADHGSLYRRATPRRQVPPQACSAPDQAVRYDRYARQTPKQNWHSGTSPVDRSAT